MEVYTIGFTKRTAPEFFGTLRKTGIKRLIDVRLNNSSQLAGFTKVGDFPFFLDEICGIEYIHEPMLAPTKDILNSYKKEKGSWEEFEKRFVALLSERRVEDNFDKSLFEVPTILLCSEASPENCHRRLILEYLESKWGDIKIVHL